MDEKILISLVSVGVGWLLAQFTTIAKSWWTARKLKHGLLTELEDIEAQLQRVILHHTRHIQMYANFGMELSVPVPVHNMFFRQSFKDAFAHLNREQRLSYQLIHASLDTLNDWHKVIEKLLEDFHRQHIISPDEAKTRATMNIWGERTISAYKSAMAIRWHILHHKQNPRRPKFDFMGPMHESYVKFEAELDEEVKKIIEGARGIKREDFERIYNPDLFVRAQRER